MRHAPRRKSRFAGLLCAMPKPSAQKSRAQSTLYRLIAAGQLVHRALAQPLARLGLQSGDDAVLLTLCETGEITPAGLAEALGLDAGQLQPRLRRLAETGLIEAGSEDVTIGVGVAGQAVCAELEQSWGDLETALLGELTPRQRRKLRHRLAEIVRRLGG